MDYPISLEFFKEYSLDIIFIVVAGDFNDLF